MYDGLYAIYGDSESDIAAGDFEDGAADPFFDVKEDYGKTRVTVFEDQDLDNGNVIVFCLKVADKDGNDDVYYAAYEIVVD